MGTDIRAVYVTDNGSITKLEILRSYCLFGWLADVRNCADIKPLSEPRGIPEDLKNLLLGLLLSGYRASPYGFEFLRSTSWYSLNELLAVDYDQIVDDENGVPIKLREFLAEDWFQQLDIMKKLGPGRFVFGFDQ